MYLCGVFMIFTTYDMVLFGRKLKEIRKELKYTQSYVYQKVGVHTDTIRRLEKGVNIPNYDTLEKLTLLYGYDLIYTLSLCKKDICLQDIYNSIDKIMLDGSYNALGVLETAIQDFLFKCKTSQIIDIKILEQCKSFLKSITIFIKNDQYNTADLIDKFKECLSIT